MIEIGTMVQREILHSPYNLGRNQGLLAKRTKSVKWKKKNSFHAFWISTNDRISSRSEFASNTSQLPSSENESSETDEMECSDNDLSVQNTEVNE